MYVFEPVGMVPGDDTVVRRKVFAGAYIADNWTPEDEGAVEDWDVPTVGLGAAPAAYKEQLDDTGVVKEEHAPAGKPPRGRRAEAASTSKASAS
jgi:hypothetical protein